MKSLANILLLSALALAGGCASGDLTIDAMLFDEMQSVIYRLEPTGRLTVTPGGGVLEGSGHEPIHTAQVDEAGMARLKKVVARSGFLLADTPIRAGLAGGPGLRLEVELGLWHNVVRLHGTSLPSATRIINEMNRHLPAKFALNYNPPPPEREQEQFEEFFR